MEIIIRRRDIYVVTAILLAFLSWVAYAQYVNQSMRQNLRDLAAAHVDEWFASEPAGTLRENFEYVAIVDSEREYELFGPTYGVVHLYIREKGDVECKTFKGMEYFYRGDGRQWILEDSAGCGAKEHHVRAFETYLGKGYGVEETVIDNALGINFDVAQLRARVEHGHVPTPTPTLATGDAHLAEETQSAPAMTPAGIDDEGADDRDERRRRGGWKPAQTRRDHNHQHEHADDHDHQHHEEGAIAQ
jgi:hypothetical protein